jgi:aspartate-semialdehyde dehydrogenase
MVMSSDFYFRNKIPVAVLGAIGELRYQFVHSLRTHPWFKLITLLDSGPPSIIDQPCLLVFSCLASPEAKQVEYQFAEAGYVVASCFAHHLLEKSVPLIVGEVNTEHFTFLSQQPFAIGKIVANPSRLVINLVLSLKPLSDRFGLEVVKVAIPPSISEDETLKKQTLDILGLEVSIHSMTAENDLATLSIQLREKGSREQIIQAWREFGNDSQRLSLPSVPFHPVYYFEESQSPEPQLQRSLDKDGAVSVGSLRPLSDIEYQFTLLSQPTQRSLVRAALLNAELLVLQGQVYW